MNTPTEIFYIAVWTTVPQLFLKILGPSHSRSGNQVRSSEPTSEKKLSNRVTVTVVERNIGNFQDLVFYEVSTTCISRFFYIGDLRLGQFRDLPYTYISQGGNSNASNTNQICSNRSEPCYIRLLLMTSVQLCICDHREGNSSDSPGLLKYGVGHTQGYRVVWYTSPRTAMARQTAAVTAPSPVASAGYPNQSVIRPPPTGPSTLPSEYTVPNTADTSA